MPTDRRPTLTTALAVLAIALALTGTAYAAGTVGTSDIKDAAVTTPKLAPEAVSGPKIERGAVGTSRIRNGNIRAADLGTLIEVTNDDTIDANEADLVHVDCPEGTVVISGGHHSSHSLVVNADSYRSGNGWSAYYRNMSNAAHQIYARAYCLRS